MPPPAIAIILLAEDVAPVRELAKEMLEEEGYQVIAVENGSEALKLLASDQRVDLLFTDIIMPGGIDGVELAICARTMRDHLKVLFTSGHRVPEIDAADTAFLAKPYRMQEMVQAVRHSLETQDF